MPRFSYNKLVRDKILDKMIATGEDPVWRRVDDPDEAIQALLMKAREETGELRAKSKNELIDELADVREVLDALAQAAMITPDEIEAAQALKRTQEGGFDRLIFVESTRVDEDNPWYPHVVDDPRYILLPD